MKTTLKLGKKGILILPKQVREQLGIEEGSPLTAEIQGGKLILQPLKPKIVEVDPNLIDELLREEYRLEEARYRRLLKR